jgi:hypothetical protein
MHFVDRGRVVVDGTNVRPDLEILRAFTKTDKMNSRWRIGQYV